MLKLVDSHDLKSCGFSRPSSSLGEATNTSQRVSKTTRNLKQFVYDNVYDMISCIRLTKRKGSSAIDYQNSRLKILAACGVPVRVWPRAPLNIIKEEFLVKIINHICTKLKLFQIKIKSHKI